MTINKQNACSMPGKDDDAIGKLKHTYDDIIGKLKHEHDEAIGKLKHEHDRETRQLRNELNKKDRRINKLEKMQSLLRATIDGLNENVSDLKKAAAVLKRENGEMSLIVREQDKKLDYYENAHVPSSKQGPFHHQDGDGKKSKEGNAKVPSKSKDTSGSTDRTAGPGRGGVRGHRGGTRIFKPTKTVRHTAQCCPDCGGTHIRDCNRDGKRTMVSIPEFVPHTVTLHKIARYGCPDCGADFQADAGLPPRGQFDWSVIRYVTYQYGHRKTARMIADDLANLYKLAVSDEAVRGIFWRAAPILKPVRDGYLKELEESNVIIMDETTYKGEPRRWMLAIRNDDTVVYMHAQSRGATDLISQAKGCVGIIIRDGYTGYDAVFPDSKKQRCTQHLTRESKNIAMRTGCQTADQLYHELSETFAELRKWTQGRHSAESRRAYVTKLQKWLRRIISRYKRSTLERLQKFGTTLENAAPQLFTFVLHPSAHSTTNLGEQSIKQVIGQRNSRIQLKSDKGAESLCIMLSCTETWKLRKLNVWKELCRAIGPPVAHNN